MSWVQYQTAQDPDLPARTEDLSNSESREVIEEEHPVRDLDELARKLLLPKEFLQELDWLLDQRRAVILLGPPGSGKTYLARALGTFYGQGREVFIQFHPSYSYDDFVEGFRPQGGANGIEYKVKAGPLRVLAARAEADLEVTIASGKDAESAPLYVLVIDEINRANLSKVLGELFFALEYRGEPVLLPYSKKHLRLPKNLLVIGTMNTADRSIATFDAALRRRFHFVECDPLKPPFKGLLRRYFQSYGRSDLYWLSDLLETANDRVPDPAYAIGASHFMSPSMTERDAARIWRHSVWPYLTGRFDVESIADLRWERLHTTDSGAAVAAIDSELLERESDTAVAQVGASETDGVDLVASEGVEGNDEGEPDS